MRFQEIQQKAKQMGIKTFRMKKVDMIKKIQREEGNVDCFATERAANCEEAGCLWRKDCLAISPNYNMAHN